VRKLELTKNGKNVKMLTVLKLQSLATSFILFSSVPVVVLMMSFGSGIVHILVQIRMTSEIHL